MKKLKENDGFTILEVMVSIVILTLSLLLLLNMAMIALEGNSWSNQATASTQLLQEKLEELRTDSDPETGSDSVTNMARSWVVTTVADHLRRIDITATWYNRRGDAMHNSMTAYIRTNEK